jgi:hypothetical protein
VLYAFKVHSQIPMSTTWVFVGLLAGREIGMAIRGTNQGNMRTALQLMGKDLIFVTIGLIVSLALAIAVNDDLLPF